MTNIVPLHFATSLRYFACFGLGSATGSHIGSRTKSQESLTSAPASQAKSPATGDLAAMAEESRGSADAGELVREPTPVPQTR